MSNVRPFAAPHVANLDNPAGFNDKSLLSIDQPARLLDGNRNTAQLGQTGPGSLPWPTTQNPTTSGGTTGFDNSGRMMVNTNTGNGAYGNGPAPNNSANPGGAREIMPNTTGSTQNYGLNDNFQPASPAGRSLNFFGSNNGTSSSPSPYANAGNPSLYNRDNRTAIPYLASNANPTTSPGYLDNHGLQPGGQAGYPAPPSSLTQQQQSPYANPPFVNSNSVPPFRYTSGTQFNSELPPINDQPQPTDKLLPFLLLFSIIGNVYFVLWMGHLRHRYRQLLSDKRGIPISVLEN